LGFLAVASEQQKSPGQPFLGGVKELIDQILLDSDIPRKHISHEAVGERMLGAMERKTGVMRPCCHHAATR
jgi:hypothetical protein